MKHTNHFKRFLALMLCVCMVLGMVPLSALATEEPATVTLYFNNTESWSTVNIYYWNSGNTNMTTWPGNGMNDQGNGIWYFEIPADATHVIFNNGSTQTADLPLPTDGSNCYAYGTQSWSVYPAGGGGEEEALTGYTVDIGGTVTAYTDFNEAVDAACAAEAATLTLYQDVEVTSCWFVGGNVTLNLNGKTVNRRPTVNECTLTVTDTAEIKGTVVNYAGAAFDYVSGKLIILDTTDCFGAGEGHKPWLINRSIDAAEDAGTIGTTGTEVMVPLSTVKLGLTQPAPTPRPAPAAVPPRARRNMYGLTQPAPTPRPAPAAVLWKVRLWVTASARMASA